MRSHQAERVARPIVSSGVVRQTQVERTSRRSSSSTEDGPGCCDSTRCRRGSTPSAKGSFGAHARPSTVAADPKRDVAVGQSGALFVALTVPGTVKTSRPLRRDRMSRNAAGPLRTLMPLRRASARSNAATVRVDVVVARAPVRDRDPDREAAVPDRSAHPRLAARLHSIEHGTRRLVVVEAQEHLVQDHVVQDLAAGQRARSRRRTARARAQHRSTSSATPERPRERSAA